MCQPPYRSAKVASGLGSTACRASAEMAQTAHMTASRRGGEALWFRWSENATKNDAKTCRNGMATSDASGTNDDACAEPQKP
jgi:hypothetical protein